MADVRLALSPEIQAEWTALKAAARASLDDINHAIKAIGSPIFDEQVFDEQITQALAALAGQIQHCHEFEEQAVFTSDAFGTSKALARKLSQFRSQHTDIELKSSHAIDRVRILKQEGFSLATASPLVEALVDLRKAILLNFEDEKILV